MCLGIQCNKTLLKRLIISNYLPLIEKLNIKMADFILFDGVI